MRDLELPREALVNVIVRDGHAIPPRGSTELREGDELHILVRGELRDEVEELTEVWHEGPVGQPAAAAAAAARPPRRSSRCARRASGDDPLALSEVDGDPGARGAAQPPRRHRRPGRPRRRPLRGHRRRTSSRSAAAGRWRAGASGAPSASGDDPAERAWWQEVTGR